MHGVTRHMSEVAICQHPCMVEDRERLPDMGSCWNASEGIESRPEPKVIGLHAWAPTILLPCRQDTEATTAQEHLSSQKTCQRKQYERTTWHLPAKCQRVYALA